MLGLDSSKVRVWILASSVPLKKVEIVGDDMVVCLGNLEQVITDEYSATLNTVNVICVDYNGAMQTDEVFFRKGLLPCGQGKYRAVWASVADNMYVAIVVIRFYPQDFIYLDATIDFSNTEKDGVMI